MSDNVIDLNSRRKRNDNPSVLGLAEQLIAMEGIIETVAVLADVSHDFRWLQLFEGIPDTPQIRERVYDIIREAVDDL